MFSVCDDDATQSNHRLRYPNSYTAQSILSMHSNG